MKPTQIKVFQNRQLQVRWEDNSVSGISFDTLRRSCPCATCEEEREQHGAAFHPLYLMDQISLDSVSPVGNYAITLKWKDGHSTGIYEYPFLISLTEKWL